MRKNTEDQGLTKKRRGPFHSTKRQTFGLVFETPLGTTSPTSRMWALESWALLATNLKNFKIKKFQNPF